MAYPGGALPSYQQLRERIDTARLSHLQQQRPVPPMQHVTPLVRAHSLHLDCPELLVWEQVNHGQELYIPPGDRYDIYLRLRAPAPIVQWRGGVLDVRQQPAGEIVIAPPFQAMYFRTFGPGMNLHLSVLPELLMRAAGADRPGPAASLRNCFGERDEVLAGIGHVLHAHLRVPGPGSRAFLQSMGMALAVRLLERFGQAELASAPGRLSPALLARIDAYVDEHLHERISLQQLAELTALPPHAFYRAFKASRSVAPLRHVTAMRMRRARTLVKGSRQPIGEIAILVGFADIAHFTNAFRRFWGDAPSRLRGGTG